MAENSKPEFWAPEAFMPRAYMKAMPDMADWARQMSPTSLPAMPVSPLMMHPMAATAAATAVGLGMASQMIGHMVGSIQGASEASQKVSDNLAGLAGDMSLKAWGIDWAVGDLRGRTVWGAPGLAREPEFEGKTVEGETVPAPSGDDAAPVAINIKTRQNTVKAKTKARSKVVQKAKPDVADDVVSKAKPQVKSQSKAIARPETKPETRSEPETKSRPAAAAAGKPATATATPVADKAVSSKILPEDFVRPKGMDKPETTDDLKAISGIGPKLEQVLNGLGIWTFAQIAALSAEEVAWLDDYLQFAGRITRDNWIRQAAALSAKN